MIAVFVTFVVEMVAFRVGAELAQKLAYDPHVGGHHHAAEHGHSHTASTSDRKIEAQEDTSGEANDHDELDQIAVMAKKGDKDGLSAAASEILGVGILEFGVIFRKCSYRMKVIIS
jgi:zinc transporter 1/2/3